MPTQTSNAMTALIDAVRETLAGAEPSAEELSTAAGALHELANGAREAGLSCVCEGSELLARLVELSRDLPFGSEKSDVDNRRSMVEFVTAALGVVETAGAGDGENGQVEAICTEARSKWGEYLEIIDDGSSRQSGGLDDPWSEGELTGTMNDAEHPNPEDARESDDVAGDQLELILTALSSAGPSAPEVSQANADATDATGTDGHTFGPEKTASRDEATIPSPPSTAETDFEVDLLDAYLDDASRCLSSIEQSVLRLERLPDDKPALQQICRELHTLKGASASVGLQELGRYLHEVEDYIDGLGPDGCASTSLEALLQAVDVIRTQVETLSPGAADVFAESRTEFAAPTAPNAGRLMAGGQPRSSADKPADTFRVEASRIDRLMDLLAELVILRNDGETESHPLSSQHGELTRIIRDFRQELIEIRRVPVSGLFERLVRAARDAAHLEGKHVDVRFIGGHTGIERSLQERLYEPLLHLVRNAVSHGIEEAAVRESLGKPSGGTVTLEARGGLSSLVILVRDDGRGLDVNAIRKRGVELKLLDPLRPVTDSELFRLIFHPGFSTCRKKTEVSGRGVGMDVVARTLDGLRGRVDVDSVPGSGTTVRLTIPLYSVIEHTMIFRVAGQLFALPMHAVDAANANASYTDGPGSDDLVVVSLRELLELGEGDTPGREGLLFVRSPAHNDGSVAGASPARIALSVDEILGPEEVVVRPLPSILKKHHLLAGATLAAGGQTVLLFEGQRLMEMVHALQDSAVPTGESFERNVPR